jgi:Fe-S cluster assembly iron-binding protein IscA
MGMALEGSVVNLDKIESNGITAWIEPNLNTYMKQLGGINVDYTDRGPGQAGYVIRPGNQADKSACGGCTSC